jgi:hypothetical protein
VKRHLFNLLAAVSLVMGVATVFQCSHLYRFSTQTGFMRVVVAGDTVGLSINDFVAPGISTIRQMQVDDRGMISLPLIGNVSAAGKTIGELEADIRFAYRDMDLMMKQPVRLHVSLMKYGPIVPVARWVVFGIVPLACLGILLPPICLNIRQRYRRNQNVCLRCGYDVRASAERCPECGTAVESQPAEKEATA